MNREGSTDDRRVNREGRIVLRQGQVGSSLEPAAYVRQVPEPESRTSFAMSMNCQE